MNEIGLMLILSRFRECLKPFSALSVFSRFANISLEKREQVDLLLFSFWCIEAVSVLWLFLMVPWFSLQCVFVVFPKQFIYFFQSVKALIEIWV